MRKFTLALALAAAFTSANADEKIIYQDNFTTDNWTNSRAGAIQKIVETQDGNYLQFGDGVANYNGTRINSFWGATPWEGVELPETGYTMSFSFNFEQFGNNTSNAAQRNNEIAVWNVPATSLSLGSYWGTTNEVFATNAAAEAPIEGVGYLFKLTQCLSGTAAGEGGFVTAVNGTCFFTVNNSDIHAENNDSISIAAATWYKVTLNVKGQNVDYSIDDISGLNVAKGSYTLAEGVDNRAAGLIHYQARYMGITKFMGVKIAHEFDGDVAANPEVLLKAVKGNDREYKVTFLEDEVLHYILPGSEEEVEVDYYDAEDEVSGDNGVYSILCTKSGVLKTWTTKRDAKSDVIETSVEAGEVQLPAPVAAIASVEEGFGKTFKVTVDNASVILAPAVGITYEIEYDGEAKIEGELSNGATIKLEKKGTMTITVNSIPVNGVEYYTRNQTVINNDVEYVVAVDKNYMDITEEELAANPAFEKATDGIVTDTNTSHWQGKWMNEHTKNYNDALAAGDPVDGLDWWRAPSQVFASADEVNAYIWVYTLINDEAGVNYAKELLPLIPNTARANVGILREEGVVVNGTSYNNLEVTFDPRYVSDDPAKPNFIEIKKTNGYDRYDKQPGCNTTDIVDVAKTDYLLYRFDTAIHTARVFTYKGFTPLSDEEAAAIQSAKVLDVNAPMYNAAGMKVNESYKGIVIQNGKKFIRK